MITKRLVELLQNREFISVATCDFNGRPNIAPKFVLKFEHNCIYLVDYIIGTTWDNITINPRVSLSLMDPEFLIGYRLNGSVEIIEKGHEYDKLLKETLEKQVSLSTKRIIEGVSTGKKHASFEVAFSQKFAVFKISIEEVTEIMPQGELRKEKT